MQQCQVKDNLNYKYKEEVSEINKQKLGDYYNNKKD